MLLPRILTALIGLPVVLAAIHYGGIVYMVFVDCVILLCLYEYSLVLTSGKKPVHTVSLLLFGLLMAAVAIVGRTPLQSELPNNLYPFSMSVVICGVLLLEVLTPNRSWERSCNTFAGIFIIPWSLAHLINLRDIPQYGEYLTLFMFITVMVSDTGAYFSGRFFGCDLYRSMFRAICLWNIIDGEVFFLDCSVRAADTINRKTTALGTYFCFGYRIRYFKLHCSQPFLGMNFFHNSFP